MSHEAIRDRLLAEFDRLPGQMQIAAKVLLDHPADAALLSMRDLAKRANLPPATLTRLAQRLGYGGFEDLRSLFANAVRDRPGAFVDRAEGLRVRRSLDGDGALVADTLATQAGHLRTLSDPATIATIGRVADLIIARKRLFCVGARSSYPAMFLGSYLLGMVGEDAVLVEGTGGVAFDRLRGLTREDAMLALSIAPYTTNTVEAVAFAGERRAAVIALTDSLTSPIARKATETILVPIESPSFLHTMTPAFLVVECLAALVAARRGTAAVKAIARSETHLERFASYTRSRSNKRDRA